jgi:CBS domain-containing protein
MSTAGELLDTKGRAVFSIDADATVYDAVVMMAEKNIGALIVTSDESQLAGIISERDYARKVILKDRASKDTPVRDIMTADVIVGHEETMLQQCMALMIQNRIRHLPITTHGEPVGIVTLGDCTGVIMREQSETIEELESLIMEDAGGEG